MENKSKNSSKLTSSNNSLKNELASAQLISCKSCGLAFQNEKELNVHKQEKHKMQILQKVEELQRQILCQRSSLTSSLLKLKETRISSSVSNSIIFHRFCELSLSAKFLVCSIHPSGGWPSLGWWVTILRMVGDNSW